MFQLFTGRDESHDWWRHHSLTESSSQRREKTPLQTFHPACLWLTEPKCAALCELWCHIYLWCTEVKYLSKCTQLLLTDVNHYFNHHATETANDCFGHFMCSSRLFKWRLHAVYTHTEATWRPHTHAHTHTHTHTHTVNCYLVALWVFFCLWWSTLSLFQIKTGGKLSAVSYVWTYKVFPSVITSVVTSDRLSASSDYTTQWSWDAPPVDQYGANWLLQTFPVDVS